MTTKRITWSNSELPWAVETLTDAVEGHEERGTSDSPDGKWANDRLTQLSARLAKLRGNVPVDAEASQGEQSLSTSTPSGGARAPRVLEMATEKQVAMLTRLIAERDHAKLATVPADPAKVTKRRASDLIGDLLACPVKAGAVRQDAATDPQKSFIAKLAAERGQDVSVEELTKAGASKLIEQLKALPVATKASTGTPAAELSVGIYRVGEQIYKVYPNQSRTHLLAKVLVLGTEPTWEYRGAAQRFVKADQRMSLEEAKEFGRITGVCCQCGRMLTDEGSIEAGIGPICAKKEW